MPELNWAGKTPLPPWNGPSPAFRVLERVDAGVQTEADAATHPAYGRLYLGTASDVGAALYDELGSAFQMLYMDPPFYTGRSFVTRSGAYAYSDNWQGDEEGYLNLLYQSFEGARRLLSPTGLLFVHLDDRANAWARLLLDEIFGASQFRNELIWHYQSGGRSRNHFSRKHDTILMYSKSRDYHFYADAVGTERGRGRRNHMRRGVDESGKVYYAIQVGGKEYRYYEDERRLLCDVWTDIPHLQQRHPERVDYRTQKPQALLERLILASTLEGDLIGDLFCGSGTTLAAAARLNRRFIGGDASEKAIDVSQRRLHESRVYAPFLVLGRDNSAQM